MGTEQGGGALDTRFLFNDDDCHDDEDDADEDDHHNMMGTEQGPEVPSTQGVSFHDYLHTQNVCSDKGKNHAHASSHFRFVPFGPQQANMAMMATLRPSTARPLQVSLNFNKFLARSYVTIMNPSDIQILR